MLTIEEFLEMFLEPGLLTVEIYSFEKNDTVWKGCAKDVPLNYKTAEIESFDTPTEGGICINIE